MNHKISLQVWGRMVVTILAISTWGNLSGQQVYYPLYNNTTFDNKAINTALSVGTTAGSADVANGAASYNIPIEIPAGTNGVVPNVSINYNSQGGNGHLGLGWSIGGLSVITRSLKTMYHDGVVESAKFAGDRFAIDGMRLISKTGAYGGNGSTYGKEMEDFCLITSFGGTTAGNPDWFKVVQKDGVIMEYGNSATSKFRNEANTETIFWRLNRIAYPDGNYIDFIYNNSDRDNRIDEIKYTGNLLTGLVPYNTIKFQYLDRNLSVDNTTYEVGNTVNLKYLLNKIVITADGNAAFKTYNFQYSTDGSNVFLSEIYEQGSDGSQLNPTIFQYGTPGPELPIVGLLIELDETKQIFSGDYDGDGVTDFGVAQIAIQDGEPVHESFKVYENNYGAAAPDLKFTKTLPYTGFVGADGNRYNYFSGDYTGDGADDIMYSYAVRTLNTSTGEFLFVFQNSTIFSFMDNWGANTEIVIPRPSFVYSVFANGKRSVIPGDYNGDGLIDFIVILRHIDVSTDYKAFIYYGGGLPQFTEIVLPTAAVYHPITNWGVKNVNSIDFDGDGRNELMITRGGTSEIFRFNFAEGVTVHAAGFPTEYHLMWFGDMNGDKKTDILVRPDLNNHTQWYTAYGTGTGYVEFPFSWSNGVNPIINENYEGTIINVADFNGDNRSDIMKGRTNSNANYEMCYSSGTGYHRVINPWLHNADATVVSSGDFNGDGRSDIIFRNTDDADANYLEFNSQGEELIMRRIKNGHGHVTTWTYNKLTEFGTTYTRTESTPYPVHTVQVPMYVVNTFAVQGITTTIYRYQDMKMHKGGRALLGFKKITKYNSSQNMYEDSEFELNTQFNILVPKYVINRHGSTILKQRTINNIITQQNTGTYQKQLWHRISSIYDDNIFEGTYMQSTNNLYDSYGNVTRSTMNNNGIETTLTVNEFAAYASHAHNRITVQTVTQNRAGQSDYTKTAFYFYTPKGQMSLKQDFAGQPLVVNYQYFYNTLGCQDSTRVSTAGQTPRTSKSIYDPKGKFVMTSRNTLGQSSTISEYDVRWGKPKVSTGIDGLTTLYSYDAFGRLYVTTMPQGHTITTLYLWGGVGQEIFHIKTLHPGKPDIIEYKDKLSRTLRSVADGFNNLPITSMVTYDTRGNVVTTTGQHLSTETPLVTTSIYDFYNRLEKITNALTTTEIVYSYSGGNLTTTTTKIIPSGNQVSSKVTDATNKLISATDYGGTLTYEYYSHGGAKNVKIAGQTLVSHTYDDYARKKTATDINVGTIQYEYDGYGQLVKETNALGHLTTMIYNDLGQLTTKTGVEGISSFEFYPTGSGASVNKLKKITSFGGDTEMMAYDNYGRMITGTRVIGSETFVASSEYNIYGLKTKETYPSGYVINYNYDTSGYILNLKDANNITIYENTGMNGYNQNTNYTYGNAKTAVKSYHYNIPTGFLSGAFEMDYSWDYASGNLLSRTLFNQTESFTYDSLNRLKTTSHLASPITVNYAQNGNIIGKTDAGPDYTYDTNRIHAMNGITTPNYPNNINLSAQNISYTSYLKPEIITETNQKLQYKYGHDYNRIKSTRSIDGVLQEERYYLGTYEKQIIGATTRDIHYIDLGHGLITIIVRENGGNFDMYYPYTDYLGSIISVVDYDGFEIAGCQQNYDAWGRNRNINFEYTNLITPPTWLYRGYTGHEHLREFRLINMNGRIYDPVLGRVLSPDNVVSMPDNTQSYNRYSYVVNNPLRYTDPDGNEPISAILIGAAVSVVFNGLGNVTNHRNFFDNAGQAAFFGALSGGMSAGIGEVAAKIANPITKGLFQAAAHGLAGAYMSGLQGGNPMAGFASGSLSSIVGSFVGTLGAGAAPTLIGGALSGGVGAHFGGGNFWDGVQQGLITTALNHLAAHANERNLMEELLDRNNIKPHEKAEFNMETVYKILNIEMFQQMENEAKCPAYKFVGVTLGKVKAGEYKSHSHTLELTKVAFRSNLYLALTIGHELQHAIDYNNYFAVWLGHRRGFTITAAVAYSEYRAYSWDYYWSGNYSGNTVFFRDLKGGQSKDMISTFGVFTSKY